MSDQYSFADDDFASIPASPAVPYAVGNVGSDGQSAGTALTLSKKFGVPGSVADADLSGVQEDIQRRQASSVVGNNPTIQSYLQSDPLHAKISHDDYEHLDKIVGIAQETKHESMLSQLNRVGGLQESIPQFLNMIKSPEGQSALFSALKKYPAEFVKGMLEQVELPGNVASGKVDINTEEGLDQALGLGTLIGLGRLNKLPVTGKTAGTEVVAPKTIRPESEAMLKNDITPPPGFDPIVDEVHTQQAKLDSINLDKMIEERDQSVTRTRSVDAFEDLATKATDNKYIQIPADAIADLYASEKKVPSADDGLLGWIPDLEQKVKDAQATGGDIEVSLGGYVARIDSGVHGKLQDFLRLRRDGVSLAESKELLKGEKVTEPQTLSSDPVQATLQTIAQIQQEALNLKNPVFADAKAAGMTEPEFARYSKKINDRQEAIDEKAIAAASREIKRRQSAEWKANEAEVKAEVQTDTKYNPTLMADEYFRTGSSPNEFVPAGLKITESSKRAGLPKEMFSKDGVHPDDIAPLFQFGSGEALLNRLEILEAARRGNKETPDEHLSRIVNEETARRMESKYGNLDENIRKEAEEAVMGQQQLDILADELRALAKQSGEEFPLTKDQLGKMIKDKFDSTAVESLADSKKLQREVGRAGQQVERALLKGDVPEAFKWAQRRLLSFGLAREALRFEKEKVRVDKNINALTNDKEVGSVAQDHVEQARSMLNGVGYTGSEAVKPGLNHAQFVADSNGQIAVAPWMVDPNLRSFKGPEDISVKDFRDLGKSLQSIMHAGREATKLENIHGKADLQNVIFDIKKQLDRFDLINQPINPSIGQRTKSLGRWLNAWSLLVERMMDYTDKFDPNGPLTSYLDRPLRDSNTKEIKLTEETTWKLRALQKYTDNSIMDIIPNDVIPRALNESGLADLNRRNLRQLMGHMGSESGIEKVTKGFGVKAKDVWRLIHDNATEADWKWVSGMHELFNDLWKESAAMQERDTGVAADPIDPVKMDSKKFGEFSGGYWPVKYDKRTSNIEGHIASKNPLFDEHYTQAATPQQYTLTRTQFAAPLDLTGQLLGTHIQGMVHDIAFREAVRNAGKLINNEEFMASMTQKWGGEYAGLLHTWLKDIANSHNVDDSYAQGAAKWSAIVRQNVTSALIFLNPGTVIKHGLTAASMSAAQVGVGGISKATLDLGIRGIVQSAKDIAKSPRDPRPELEFVDALKMVTDPSPRGDQVRQFILDSSAVMRNRNRNAQDTIRASYEKSINSPTVQMFSDARQISLQIGRFPVSLSDAVSAMPTWYARYKDAFARTGDHTDAVFEADRTVARAHGSSAIMDKSRVMRTGEAMRWVTPLYNFWNHMNANMLQLKWDIGAKISGREEPGANAASIGGRLFAYTVIPILAEELATAPLDEDHKHGIGTKMALATIRYLGGQYIGIRDITNALAYGNEPSVGLLGTVSHAIWSAGQDIARLGSGQVVSKNWMIHAGTALGMATGMGGTQVGKTGSFVKDLLRGSEKNLSFDQLRQGLRTGHSKPRVQK